MPAAAATAKTGLPTQSSSLTAALGTFSALATSEADFFAYSASVASCAFLSPSSPCTRRVTSSASAFCGIRASGCAFISASSAAISSSGRIENTLR